MEDKHLPKVALITVYYNRPNKVEESIQSVIDQTYQNLEIIIIDDCSKDHTFRNLQKMEKQDPRIMLLRNERNKGFTNTLIDTIRQLQTKYIAIHGAGDISMPTRIEEQVSYLENNPEVGVLTTDLNNNKTQVFPKLEITTQDLLQKNRIFHGAVMFRLEKYKQVGGYRSFFKFRQDFDLWTRMSLITKIHFLPKKLYEIISVENSVSRNDQDSAIPILLSMFVHFSIRERIETGTDSLDQYGEQAGLLFIPSKCNRILRKKILLNLRKRKYDNCILYTDNLIKFNSNKILLLIFKASKFLFIKLNKKRT